MLKFLLLFFLMTSSALASQNSSYGIAEIDLNYNSNNENTIKRKASYFPFDSKSGVILVHQSGYTMNSWYFFSEILQKHEMASIALENISVDDIRAAVKFLQSKGYKDISLIGASLGGASVLRLMDSHPNIDISKVILLAPAVGPALQSNVEKLIIVSKNDFYSDKAYETYNEASKPKLLKEYSGSAHAQKLFNTNHKENLITTIVNFLKVSN